MYGPCAMGHDCVSAIGDWCASRRLQLNPSKTEMTWFVSLASLRKIAANDLSLRVGSDVITSVDAVRDLGATLDSQLTMQQHVNKVASACFFRSDVWSRFDGSSDLKKLPLSSLRSFWANSTTAMLHWPVCSNPPLYHFSGHRMQRLDLWHVCPTRSRDKYTETVTLVTGTFSH